MKRILPYLLFAFMLFAVIAAFVIRNWDPYRSIPQVSLTRLNSQETAWYSAGITDYRILVLVRFAAEQRRYEIIVRNYALNQAGSSTYDQESKEWSEFTAIEPEEAEFFTVPGMFALLRTELANENVDREVLRMALAQDAVHPGTIYLGDIIQEGITMEGTDLFIEVLEFESLSSE